MFLRESRSATERHAGDAERKKNLGHRFSSDVWDPFKNERLSTAVSHVTAI
jgi:hypothetical protein